MEMGDARIKVAVTPYYDPFSMSVISLKNSLSFCRGKMKK